MKRDLFLDVDGVVFNSIDAVVSLYNEDFKNHSNFVEKLPEDIYTWAMSELEFVTPQQIDNYFNDPRFFERVKLFEDALEFINEQSKVRNVTFVSLGHEENLIYKSELLFKYFPEVKQILINLDSKNGVLDKSEVNMEGGIMIDDNSNCLETCNADYKFIFGNEYEFNKESKRVRLKNWNDVKEIISLIDYDDENRIRKGESK